METGIRRLSCLAILANCLLISVVSGQVDDNEFFESKIRPIFAEYCSECHSSESDPISGGLNLGSRKAMLVGGDTGPAMVPGDPGESLIVDAINYRGYYEMPPNSKLPQDKIDLIEEWIKRGSPWPKHDHDEAVVASSNFDLEERRQSHWAWQPIGAPEHPTFKDDQWCRDPIDHFVLAKLIENGLSPSSETDKRTWIRRVYFDLIGLPPTKSEIEAFAADESNKAYESVVDHLLSSSHFGERWARHWMDLFRYAETYGHEFDYPIEHAYQYRDYLIRAFNEDVAYDRLIKEHVAGDLLADPRLNSKEGFNESIIGTGFWFLGEATHGPVDVKADEAGRIDNQIDVLTKTFQGLTVACARCHDHKFDAISDEDYYALSGFLQSSRRQIALLDPGQKIETAYRQAAKLANDVAIDSTKLMDEIRPMHHREWRLELRPLVDPASDEEETAADTDVRSILKFKPLQQNHHPLHALTFLPPGDNIPKYQVAELAKSLENQKTQYERFVSETELFEDFSNGVPSDWFVTGWGYDQPDSEVSISAVGNLLNLRSVVSSGRLGSKFQSVLRSPTFELTHDKILLRVKGVSCRVRLIIDGYEMDIHNPLLFSECKIDVTNGQEFTWVTMSGDVKNYKGHRAYLEVIDHGDGFIQVDKIRFADNGSAAPVQPPSKLAEWIVEQSPKKRSEILTSVSIALEKLFSEKDLEFRREQLKVLSVLAKYLPLAGQVDSAVEVVAAIDAIADVPAPMKAVAMTDGTAEDEHLFIRGNSQTLGDIIPRRFLTALLTAPEAKPSMEIKGSGRLELANHIASANNPLTSRVAVNRIWHHLIGRGIVSSVDNFGVLGHSPSHPELLDYLANEFVDSQWSVKSMIRRIVLSNTYRMDSEILPSANEKDPENKWLHRAHIKRLEGEAIRDSVLKVSGSLNKEMYGPSVSIHLTDFMQGRGRPRKNGPIDGDNRRSVYVEVRRNFLAPMMLAFDSPIPFNTIGSRHQSNVPAQALIMMNDPFIVEQAKKWAEKIVQSELTTPERIENIFVAAFGRPATNEEITDSLQFLKDQTKESDVESNAIRENHRVWQDYCHVVFNMKEFIYIK